MLLALTARTAWASVRTHPQAALAAWAGLLLLQSLQAGVDAGQLAGFSFHLLGLNLAALMLGAAGAFWLGCTVLLLHGCTADGAAYLGVFPANALCVLLPACALNGGLRRFGIRRLPPHLFVYIFVYGFLCAAAGMLITGTVTAAALQYAGTFPAAVLWRTAFPVFFLLAWGEAFLSGLFAAVFAVFRPHLLATFDDAVYLRKNRQIWRD